MSPDFRYHIASLAAVFLALGVGILVGTAFVGAPVVNRQTQLIRHLEAGVSDLRRETAERQQTEEALRILLPRVVGGTLMRKRVLVIQAGGYPDAAGEAADALRMAGATVERVAFPGEAWRRPAEGETAPPSDESLIAEARPLAALLVAAANEPLAKYRDRGLLTGDPALLGAVHLIVLVGGGSGPTTTKKSATADAAPDESVATLLARTRDLALIQAWQEQGITVVGVEPFGAEISFIRTYQSEGITTVDCIDRAAGKIALPFALMGEKGNYGMKPTADRVLPASLDQVPPTPAPSTDTP